MEMRKVLSEEFEKLMLQNENIILIEADSGKPVGLADLKNKFPDRVIDIGIAEQNMASVAAGMSSYGFIPFITTFTPFATRRICDQITISISYAKQNVKIIGADPGICAELNGGTHMSLEDIGVLRSIPNIVIYEPVDCNQLKKALPQIVEYNGPVYIRFFRKEIENVFNIDYDFDLFKASKIQDGSDISIFCSGIMVQETMKANEILKEDGIKAEIINIHTIKPIDKQSVIKSAKKTGAAVTVENHNLLGGLKSAVSEILCEECCGVPLKSIGVKDRFGEVGKLPYLKEIYKMRSQDIVNAVKEVLN